MWCTDCKQDVPAIAAKQATGQIVCARCGAELAQGTEVSARNGLRFDLSHSRVPTVEAASGPTMERRAETDPSLDDWDADWIDNGHSEDLMRASVAITTYRTSLENGLRLTDRLQSQETNGESTACPTQLASVTPRGVRVPMAWFVVCIGMTLFAFGGVLSGWAMVVARPEFWRIGLPTFFVGQAVLVLGLLFQLERLLQLHRQTETTLKQLRDTAGRLARESSIRDQMELVQ